MSNHISWKWYMYWKPLIHKHQRWAFGEPIDDGHSYYKYKYICFNCQKCFRAIDKKFNNKEQCPNCHSTKIKCCGPMFKAPRKNDKKSWNQLRKHFGVK